MVAPTEVKTSIKTSDGGVKTGRGYVYWVAARAAATGGAFELNDSTDDSGTDILAGGVLANSGAFFGPFDPPLKFTTGIYVDIPGTNVTVTVGYL